MTFGEYVQPNTYGIGVELRDASKGARDKNKSLKENEIAYSLLLNLFFFFFNVWQWEWIRHQCRVKNKRWDDKW